MRFIPCIIEMVRTEAEDFWEISVPCEYASDAALELAALYLGRTEKIVFSDTNKCLTIRSDSVTLCQRIVTVDKDWLEAVWCLFLDVHRHGWTNTAHIEQDFSVKDRNLCIVIRLAPPA